MTEYINKFFCQKVFELKGYAIFANVILVDTHVHIYLCTMTDKKNEYGEDLINEGRSIFDEKFNKESGFVAISLTNLYH